MDSIAVANERTNHYQSFGLDDTATATTVLKLVTEAIEFAGPFTLIEEQTTYTPGQPFDGQSIDPDRPVIVYDMYGPHGIVRPDPVFDFSDEVREWIDATLEPNGDGEYAIGQAIDPEDLA